MLYNKNNIIFLYIIEGTQIAAQIQKGWVISPISPIQ